MNLKKLADPKILLPLIILSVLPAVILVLGRPAVTVPAGTWLYERQNTLFRPVWRAPRNLSGTVQARYGAYRKLSLREPDLSLWAAGYTLRGRDRFPAALLESVRSKTPDIGASPFLKKGQNEAVYLLPWLYPAFFLFVALFLLKNGWAKTVSAILIGAFLFLYTLQTVNVRSAGSGSRYTRKM